MVEVPFRYRQEVYQRISVNPSVCLLIADRVLGVRKVIENPDTENSLKIQRKIAKDARNALGLNRSRFNGRVNRPREEVVLARHLI
ncbi:MAG TPA: hypothetical protein VNA13_03765, partial [Xanthomonadales bacterium]|nr:hypothetical protein [Xanthomonadales bacterium]